jgi:hypothetical protein
MLLIIYLLAATQPKYKYQKGWPYVLDNDNLLKWWPWIVNPGDKFPA